MKRVWIYAVVAALAGFVSGCLDDDNNYDYKQINDMEGARDNFQNFKDSYSVVEGEELTFAPAFTFTIDTVAPDVSYEWYMDHKLLPDETKPTYTFKSDKCGTYEITIAVVDNKTGVRFAKSTYVQVRSLFQRGWTILSDENGRSVLHFIVPATHTYQMVHEGKVVNRDSLVYHQVMHDIVPELGEEPVGLMENLGYMDYDRLCNVTLFDELVVQQKQWAELNGNTLQREVYTYQEFRDDLPEGFSPVEACMTFSMKAVRDANGRIYWANKADVSDFHSSFYTSVGLNDNMSFSHLFEAYRLNGSRSCVLALTEEDNSFVGILDLGTNGTYTESTVIPEVSMSESGKMCPIEGEYANNFSNIEKEVVDVLPANWVAESFGFFDVTSAEPAWVALLKDKDSEQYELRFFILAVNTAKTVKCSDYCEYSIGAISDYRGMAVFNNRCYVVIADGNQLYYCQYGNDGTNRGELIKLDVTLPAKVKALSGLDLQGEGSSIAPHRGQLGVALEDGSFYIFGIGELKNADGMGTVDCKQLFPDENTPEKDKNFGKIVDMIYKIGRGGDYMSFAF